MLLHYLKIAWRNLRKYKTQTIISILGLFYLSRAVLSDEHAVVMLGVLIHQAAVQKLADHLWGDAALAQVGKHPAVIRIPGRQGKGLLHLVPLDGRHCSALYSGKQLYRDT